MRLATDRSGFASFRRFAALVAVFAGTLGNPGWGSTGTEGASFLYIPVGARPAALGSAYTALASDAYAPVWNPAGLGFVNSTELAGQHLSYLESIHYEYLGFAHPFHKEGRLPRGLGFSMQYLGSGDIAGTDINGDPIGDFDASYASYNLSYGQRLNDKLSLGVTTKWIRGKIADVTANAFAFDFGSLYHVNDRLRLAGTLTNLGTKLKFLEQGDSLPLAFRLGASYLVIPQLTLTADTEMRKTGLASFHTGTEWRPTQPISLRLGYHTDTLKGLSPLAGLTVGVGIHVAGHEFSYAWQPYGELGNAQYFSLVLRFGGKSKRNLVQRPVEKPRYSKNASPDSPEYKDLMTLLGEQEKQPVAQADSKRRLNRRIN